MPKPVTRFTVRLMHTVPGGPWNFQVDFANAEDERIANGDKGIAKKIFELAEAFDRAIAK